MYDNLPDLCHIVLQFQQPRI